MSQLTLPRLSRKRRDRSAEAAIPCATARTSQTSHLTGDRRREPTFDDLIAGNDREPSHEDLLADQKAAEQPRPKRYPGVAVETLAYLRAQDRRPDAHDKHAFDVDHLVPAAPLRTVDLAQVGGDTDQTPAPAAAEEPQTVPVGNPRLLFDALDALDRLPALYALDAASFEMAASIAAIQTYAALRPDLLDRHEFQMQLAPLAAELAEVAL